MNIWSEENLKSAVLRSRNISEVCRTLGLSASGYNFKKFKRHRDEFSIDCSHFEQNYMAAQRKNIQKQLSNAELFVEDSKTATVVVKRRVLRDKLIPYECEDCGNTGEWNGRDLVLQLDHVNGINTDNRLRNLRFLCPNCHTQTDTYAAKNKIEYIPSSNDQLERLNGIYNHEDHLALIEHFDEEIIKQDKRLERELKLMSQH